MQEAEVAVAAPRRPRVALDPVAEEEHAHRVSRAHRREGEGARHLRDEVALQGLPRAELVRGGDVDDEEDGEFPLLHEALHVRAAHAGGHLPVDRLERVAGLILADLGELDAVSAEERRIRPESRVVHEPPASQLQPPNLFRCGAGVGRRRRPSRAPQKVGQPHGTGTVSRRWSRM